MISDEKIIAALMTCGTVRSAARELNVSESTIYSRRKKPSFQQKYAERRTAVLSEAESILLSKVSQSIETMSFISEFSESDMVRLTAAQALFKACVKMVELCDLETRLKALEAAQEGQSESV